MSKRVAIGIDVGGTTIKYGLVDEDGKASGLASIPTEADEGPAAVIANVARIIRTMNDREPSLTSVGIGFPGVVDREGRVHYPPNFPGWEVVDPKKELAELVPKNISIAVENDANAAGWAEGRVGAARGEPHFLYVTLGTGVGGCIVSDGRIWRGATGGAGEFGHSTVDMNGPTCNCGARGCVESYIGSNYMIAYARQKVDRYPESLLHGMMAEGKELTPELINTAAEGGDIFAQNFLSELGRILGASLAQVMNICDLHLCIVGGGVSKAETFLLGQARRTLRARVLQSIAPTAQLRVAALSNNAGVVGAGLVGLDQ